MVIGIAQINADLCGDQLMVAAHELIERFTLRPDSAAQVDQLVLEPVEFA